MAINQTRHAVSVALDTKRLFWDCEASEFRLSMKLRKAGNYYPLEIITPVDQSMTKMIYQRFYISRNSRAFEDIICTGSERYRWNSQCQRIQIIQDVKVKLIKKFLGYSVCQEFWRTWHSLVFYLFWIF